MNAQTAKNTNRHRILDRIMVDQIQVTLDSDEVKGFNYFTKNRGIES